MSLVSTGPSAADCIMICDSCGKREHGSTACSAVKPIPTSTVQIKCFPSLSLSS